MKKRNSRELISCLKTLELLLKWSQSFLKNSVLWLCQYPWRIGTFIYAKFLHPFANRRQNDLGCIRDMQPNDFLECLFIQALIFANKLFIILHLLVWPNYSYPSIHLFHLLTLMVSPLKKISLIFLKYKSSKSRHIFSSFVSNSFFCTLWKLIQGKAFVLHFRQQTNMLFKASNYRIFFT